MELTPPSGVILVGAGTGTGDWVQYLVQRDVMNVTLIEGDEEQFHRLRRNIEPRSDWQLIEGVVANVSGPIVYHRASNRSESGLLNPESLRGVWPNLTTLAREEKAALRLGEIQQMGGCHANWLIVDCLPVLEILQGQNDSLQSADVVVARVVQDDQALQIDAAATLASFQSFMERRGWQLLLAEEGRNPAVGHALFVRDTRANECNLTARLNDACRDLASTQTQFLQEADARANAERTLAGKSAENEKLVIDLKEANAVSATLRQQVLALSQASDALDARLRDAEVEKRTAEEILLERNSRIRALDIELSRTKETWEALAGFADSSKQIKTVLMATPSAIAKKLDASLDACLSGFEKRLLEPLIAHKLEQEENLAALQSQLNEKQIQLDALSRDVETYKQELQAHDKAEKELSTRVVGMRPTAYDLEGSERAPISGFINLEVAFPDGRSRRLAFNPNNPARLSVDQGWLHFDVPEGGAVYLCSNADGDFGKPPPVDQFNLKPGLNYVVTGEIDCESSHAMVWAIEYDERHRINHKNEAVRSKRFAFLIKTAADHANLCLAIRLAGKGVLNLETTLFRVSRQSDEGSLLQKTIGEATNSVLQRVESYLDVQNYLATGKRVPLMRGWPISPDLASYIVDRLEKVNYDLVIEFGSGTSTILLARAMVEHRAKSGRLHPNRLVEGESAEPCIISFEHLEKYHALTCQQLDSYGLREYVQLLLAPLESHTGADGASYQYYRCQEALTSIARHRSVAGLRVLVFVDGPPAATGKLARYPALQQVLYSFPGARIDILMDDYIREDEKYIVRRWCQELDAEGIAYTLNEMNFEKGACLIEINGAVSKGEQR